MQVIVGSEHMAERRIEKVLQVGLIVRPRFQYPLCDPTDVD